MRIVEKSGKTEKEALESALSEAGIEKSEDIKYKYEVLQHTHKAGFLGIGGNKNVKVKLFIYDEDEKKILVILKELLGYMGIQVDNLKITKREDDRIFIDIDTPETGIIIGKRGKTLEAIQFILVLIVGKVLNKSFQIILDTGDYRAKRIKVLEQLAKNLAAKVRKYKKPVILEPMNPYERRIIHATLQEEKDITTQSIGKGVYKKIKIMLKAH